jgi:hypothetical protein
VELWGEPRGQPKAILRSRETGGLRVLLLLLLLIKGSVINERIAG